MYAIFFLWKNLWGGYHFILILQIKKEVQEGQELVQGDKVCKEWSHVLKLGNI